jgi:putative FmdB family regulatory protein
MPIYEYRCDKGHTFEAMQRMTDEPVKKCEVCGAPVQRVFHPVAVHFKGSGFYNTDYGKKTKGASKPSSSDDGGSSNSSRDSKPDKKTEKAKDSKAASSSSSSSSD